MAEISFYLEATVSPSLPHLWNMCRLQWRRYRFTWKQQILPAGPTVEICAGYNGGDIVLLGSNRFSQLAPLVKYVRVTMAEISFYLEATDSPSWPHWWNMCGLQWRRYRFTWKQQFLPACLTGEIYAGYNGGDIVLPGNNSFSQLASLVKYVRVTMAEISFYLEATVSPSLPHWWNIYGLQWRRYCFTWKQQFLPACPTGEIYTGYNGGDIVLPGSNSFSQLAPLLKYVRVTMAEILFYLEATVSPSLPHWWNMCGLQWRRYCFTWKQQFLLACPTGEIYTGYNGGDNVLLGNNSFSQLAPLVKYIRVTMAEILFYPEATVSPSLPLR